MKINNWLIRRQIDRRNENTEKRELQRNRFNKWTHIAADCTSSEFINNIETLNNKFMLLSTTSNDN